MYVYIYIYICVCVYVCMYTYIAKSLMEYTSGLFLCCNIIQFHAHFGKHDV